MTSAPDPSSHPRDLESARAWTTRMLKADYRRTLYPFGRATLAIWRAGQALRYAKGPAAFVSRRLVLLADILWTQLLMGAELPHEVCAGPGIKLEHGGRGIIFHPSVTIGADATIYHRVTIGVRDGRPSATLGDRVFLGAGATILGPVTVADGTNVGAGAVLTTDTEPGGTYVGVPARRVDAGPRRAV